MMRLSEIATLFNAPMRGADVVFTSVGIDSRTIQPGQLFVAIAGENFDGHDFVQQALQQGAVAALVEKPSPAQPSVQVANTRLALGQMAQHWLSHFQVPIVALTGSNGKTTVKEMLAAILVAHTGDAEQVLATQGNLNNDLGMPLTALRLRNQHRFAVLEMGMNHPGEIHYMSDLAKPDVALVNNVGSAHIGLLGSLQAIANAKGEIFDGLKQAGKAVINADDAFAQQWLKQTQSHTQITFALHQPADVTADYELHNTGSLMQLFTPVGQIEFSIQVPGLHNVANALAAASLALALDIPLSAIAQGLSQFNGVAGRLRHLPGIHHTSLIDDTYNANPSSMKAAIDVLAKQTGRRLMVMGDMAELGDMAVQLHREIGEYARQQGVNHLFTLGSLSQSASSGFGAGAQHFSELPDLLNVLHQQLQQGDVILIKGSRSARMERVTQALQSTQTTERTSKCC
jgi:UDP-N-acetylmuramoyl-tripeptide--D-alanyl-D-alanine ligase